MNNPEGAIKSNFPMSVAEDGDPRHAKRGYRDGEASYSINHRTSLDEVFLEDLGGLTIASEAEVDIIEMAQPEDYGMGC